MLQNNITCAVSWTIKWMWLYKFIDIVIAWAGFDSDGCWFKITAPVIAASTDLYGHHSILNLRVRTIEPQTVVCVTAATSNTALLHSNVYSVVKKSIPAVPGEIFITNVKSSFICGSPGTIQSFIVVTRIITDVFESNWYGGKKRLLVKSLFKCFITGSFI